MARLFGIVGLLLSIGLSCLFCLSYPAFALERSPAPPEAKTYFIEPADGQTVPSQFTAKFGLSGMGIAPAGVTKDNTGHHHLLIDLDTPPDMNQPLQVSDQIKHFGGGQTEASLSLPPGTHTLQLLLGNANHIPQDPPVLSDKITVTVQPKRSS